MQSLETADVALRLDDLGALRGLPLPSGSTLQCTARQVIVGKNTYG